MNAPAIIDPDGLVPLIERARGLLDEGDVEAARLLAGVAYEQAKAAASIAIRFGAAERLVLKARAMQGDALRIDARAMMRLADEWDAAQAAGEASIGGRPKTVAGDDGFTSADAGLTRDQIFQARKLAAAERREPGIIDRVIAARLAEGLEPSRANLRAAVGTDSASAAERGNNLYETPPEAVHALLKLESFGRLISEPACGRGAIARVLEQAGHDVDIADLVDYGTTTLGGSPQAVQDFLSSRRDRQRKPRDVVTNPPYGKALNAFVAHALRVHRPRKMALLLNLNFLAGFDDDDRNFALDDNPPARIHVFTRRLPMMHRDGWTGPEASSRMNTAWFAWELDGEGRYAGPTVITRVDWKDFQPEAPTELAPAARSADDRADRRDFSDANRAELEALQAVRRGVAVSGPLADALRASGLVLARRRSPQQLTPDGETRIAELEAAAGGVTKEQEEEPA